MGFSQRSNINLSDSASKCAQFGHLNGDGHTPFYRYETHTHCSDTTCSLEMTICYTIGPTHSIIRYFKSVKI